MHSKASNVGCWGDSGRYPLFIEACKLSIDYFEHVQNCYANSDNSLLAAAFSVQKDLGLDWYSNITNLVTRFSSSSPSDVRNSISTTECIKQEFTKLWEYTKNASPKLDFYNKTKTKFGQEEYLSIIKNPSHSASITRFRISSHNLFIERGRYEKPLIPRDERWCVHCFMISGTKTVEDELHAILHCPLYNFIRNKILPLDSRSPQNIFEMLSNLNNTNKKATLLISELVHKTLEVNSIHTSYYCTVVRISTQIQAGVLSSNKYTSN